VDFTLPEIGEGIYEAELTAWLVKPGDAVKRGQNLMEVMTDKAAMEIPSPFAGVVDDLRAAIGDHIQVGQAVLSYSPTGQPAPVRAAVPAGAPVEARRPAAVNGPPATPPGDRVLVRASPSVRQLARELGVDLAAVPGSGPAGRILVEDLAAVVRPPAGRDALAKPAARPPDYGKPGTRVKMVGLRRAVAERMALAKRTIADYSYVDECDATDLVKLRENLRPTYAAAGVKLTYLAFFVKAVVGALKDVPLVNSSLEEEAGEIVLHDRYDIAVAVATPTGLVAPVVRGADRLDVGAIAREIARLSEAARSGKAKREELTGGTFTVTSVGNIGGLFTTPIVNPPEVGIMGVGKVVKRPAFDAAGRVVPADLVYFSFTFDHRVVDGAVGAAFANAVIKRVQNPAVMLLPEKV
jgi:pyruvate dehydrogenase E2 component (dihydrolipoamide acetyltransferase)/2-oxoisovalerate dehydrogenase E2 component (dihydrolipoyl transacylase)